MSQNKTSTGKNRTDSYWGDVARRFFKHRLAVVSLVILVLEILMIWLLPVLLHTDPNSITGAGIYAPPSKEYIFGTDNLGRDNFARLLAGGKISLTVGFLSAALSALIGVPLGLAAGFYRGIPEMLIMRATEVFQTVPSLVVDLVVVTIAGPSVRTLILIIGVMGWAGFARLVYSSVLSIREKEYVESAKVSGLKDLPILFRYVLPNVLTPVIVSFTFCIASAILSESSLSFLGLGVQIPQASWGNILNAARNITTLSRYPWCWLPAGIVLVLTIAAINYMGDGLRDALDTNTTI